MIEFAVSTTPHRKHLESATHHADSLRDTQMTVTEKRAGHVKRTGQPRGFKHRASSRSGQHFDFQILVKDELI